MALLEDITLTDSIEIKTTPEKIFEFFTNLSDDESYRAWHPEDHVALHWIKGDPWQVGSIIYTEEYIHGKVHKLKFTVTRVIPNRLIEYAPTNRFLRIYFPRIHSLWSRKGTFVFLLPRELIGLAGWPKLLPEKKLSMVC